MTTATELRPVFDPARANAELKQLLEVKDDATSKMLEAAQSGNTDLMVNLGIKVAEIDGKVAKIQRQIAEATGQVLPNAKGEMANKLRDFVKPFAESPELMALIQEMWNINETFTEITIQFADRDGGGKSGRPLVVKHLEKPMIQIVGGFRTSTKRDEPIKRARIKYSGGTLGKQVKTSREVIELFGRKHGQTAGWSQMNPDEQKALRDKIIAGEKLQRGTVGEDGTFTPAS